MYSDDVMLRNKIIDVMELWKILCKMIVPNLIYNLPKKLQYWHQLFTDSEMPAATNLQPDNPKENLNNNTLYVTPLILSFRICHSMCH